ncbi:MAG: Ig-like domain repeat protein [Caldilineaceae bacterium]|nr:Ig-like domain repeat protein [Caldilineaceae bacterium]
MTDSETGVKYRGAEFTINDLPPGVHSIRVRYDGDRNFTAGTSAIALQTITGKQSPTVDLRSSANPAAVGAKVTFLAHLLPDTDRPTGSITFFDGTTTLGTVALANGCGVNGPVCRQASLETNVLSAGTHTITAKYSGDESFTEATSELLQQTISDAPITTLTPISLTVAPGNKAMQLRWNVTNDPKVTSYRILRNAGENDRFETIADSWTDPTFFDKGTESVPLVSGITYCYLIEAHRSDGSLAMTSNRACGVFGSLTLFVPDAIGRPGEEVIVPVNIRNADGLRIAASDIWLEFNGDIVESVAVSRTALTADYAWDSSVQDTANPPTKLLRIALINLQPATLHGDGALFWLVFKVKGTAGQSTLLDLKELITAGGSSIQDLANLSQDLPLQLTDGTFRVESAGAGYIRGDVDGNGRVAALDALVALSLAAGKRPAAANELQAGDVNSNTRMDNADASMILYYAAHGSWPVPAQGSVTSAAALHGDTIVHLSSGSAQPGENLLITLGADDLIEIAGGDFAITYDPQVVKRVVSVTQTGLAASFPAPAFNDSGSGLLTIALSNDSEINGTGALLTIEVELQSNAPQGASPLTLADAKLNDSFGRDFITSFDDNQLTRQSGVITVGAESGGAANTIYLPVVSR